MQYDSLASPGMRNIVLLASALALAGAASASQVIGIADGDTLIVLHGGRSLKVRLINIDAPEMKQPFGEKSKQSLSDLCYQRDAQLQIQVNDKYGQTVARVICAGVDVSQAQVERGMAWVYPENNKNSALQIIEIKARAARVGLWADLAPVEPWIFRNPPKQQTATIEAKPAPAESRISDAERAEFLNGVQTFGARPGEGASYSGAGAAGPIYSGPRGGQYRINSSGNRSYIKR